MAGILIAFAPFPGLDHTPPQARIFKVEASQYTFAPGTITVNPGDTVTIELVSTDVVHGLYVDGYGVSTSADPGQPSSLSFIADKTGSFRLRCNITCGAMHPFMVGKLNVGVNTWLYRSIALAVLVITIGLVQFQQTDKPRKGTGQ